MVLFETAARTKSPSLPRPPAAGFFKVFFVPVPLLPAARRLDGEGDGEQDAFSLSLPNLPPPPTSMLPMLLSLLLSPLLSLLLGMALCPPFFARPRLAARGGDDDDDDDEDDSDEEEQEDDDEEDDEEEEEEEGTAVRLRALLPLRPP